MSDQPRHGDVWEQAPLNEDYRRADGHRRFSVMTVCGPPPCVTGYWWSNGAADPAQHDTIRLPQFVDQFRLVRRESVFL